MLLDGSMPAQFVSATSNAKICPTSFMQHAERSLVAVYYSVWEIYGAQAAHSSAEAWLRIFEERLFVCRPSPNSVDWATLVTLPGISSEASVSTHLAAA